MNATITGIAVITALLCLIGTGCYAWWLRRRLAKFTDEICSVINQMINGADCVDMDLQDNLFSKISHNLTRLYGIMRENRAQLVKEKQELQELVSDVSHQVKTPIANLKMLSATLGRPDLPQEKQAILLRSSDVQLEKLDFFMQAMVKTSRLETGLITPTPIPAPIYETIALALGGIVIAAEKKGISVEVSCDDTLLVQHDKKWTAEAIFNVLDNAVKYTPNGGVIQVAAEKWELYTRIKITDNGKGIAEKHHANIWKRFYRAEDVAQIDGIGIGLYLARMIISMQDGYIKVESESDKGSTFSIFLRSS